MKLLATFVFVACSAVASPAFAQWGQPFDRRGLQHLDPTAISAEWRACTNEDYRFSAQEVIAGCSGAFEKATSGDERASVLWWRALAYERAGDLQSSTVDFNAALAEFDTWISDEPSLLEARFQRASLLISMREYDQALEAFEEVDRRRARQPNVRASIGRIAFLRGDYEGAIAEYDLADRLARRSRTAGIVAHNRCEARAAALVELDLARRICDRAVRGSQYHPAVLVVRGFLRFRQDDMVGAMEDFERALQREPNHAGALYGRATVAARNGQNEIAAADLARSLEINPRMAEYYSAAGMRP